MAAGQSILMPKLGLTMTEGVLAEWMVGQGDAVRAGQPIFIVETDKISNEIEAAEDCVIGELLAQPGDVVQVGEPVATLAGTAGVTSTAPAPSPASDADVARVSAPASSPAVAPAVSGKRLISTPLARRLAADAGIDLATVVGSGPRGRIMAEDVAGASQRIEAPETEAPVSCLAPSDQGRLLPLGQYQKVTARRLSEAKREIPHFYVFAEADVTELLELRGKLNADASLTKLTVNHFIIAAVARALAAMPEVNRIWTDEGLLELPRVDVGMAVEGPKGLVAPVLRDLGELGVDEVAEVATALVDRARKAQLGPDDLSGGACSVSNVGMFGATALVPIVNPGQSTILGVGRNKPVFLPDDQGRPVLREILNLVLSCDHRVIDGALAARFLQRIQNGVEAPMTLLRRPSQKA